MGSGKEKASRMLILLTTFPPGRCLQASVESLPSPLYTPLLDLWDPAPSTQHQEETQGQEGPKEQSLCNN